MPGTSRADAHAAVQDQVELIACVAVLGRSGAELMRFLDGNLGDQLQGFVLQARKQFHLAQLFDSLGGHDDGLYTT
ncbi:MAG: hypothetical protein R3B07_32980 [Polyangiaceae bacterium]